MDKLNTVFEEIDRLNQQDPNKVEWQGQSVAKEWLYGLRMSEALHAYQPEANEALQIAARAQHIGRWKIPRSEYPMDRMGYLQWREKLKQLHSSIISDLLLEHHYSKDMIDEVIRLITKYKFKTNPDAQLLEDVVCIVFLQHYLDEFSQKHPEEKVIEILQKTWKKISPQGQSYILELPLSSTTKSFLDKAFT